MDKYLYWLANVEGIGTAGRERLLEAFGTGDSVYGAEEKHLEMVLEKGRAEKLVEMRKTWDVDREYERLQKKQISCVCTADEEYPERLRHIPDHPFCVYYKGQLPPDGKTGGSGCRRPGMFGLRAFYSHGAGKRAGRRESGDQRHGQRDRRRQPARGIERGRRILCYPGKRGGYLLSQGQSAHL